MFVFRVSLVDFGEKIIAPFSALCKLPSEEFLQVPFQCVRFSLHGLRGARSAGGEEAAGDSGVPAGSVWDAAAKEFVEDALAGCSSVVQVRATGVADSGELCGQLYIERDGRPVSLAEELVKRGYATWDLGALPANGSDSGGRRSEEEVPGVLVESGAPSPEGRPEALSRGGGLRDAVTLATGGSTPSAASSGGDVWQPAPPCGHVQPVGGLEGTSLDALSGLGGSAGQRIMQFLEPKNKEASNLKPALDYDDFLALYLLGEEEADSDSDDADGGVAPQSGSSGGGGGGGDEGLADDIRDFQDNRGSNCMSFAEVPPDWEQPCVQFQEAVSFGTDYRPVQREWLRMGFLCHGPIPPMPAASIDEMSFDSFVTEQLRSLGFRRPSRTQSVLWPVVLNNRNVLAVAPPHSGRTLAYLVPIVSRLLMEEKEYQALPSPGAGPLVLVLSSSWEGAQRIHDQVAALQQSRLLQPWNATSVQVEYRDPRCCLLYGGGGEDGKELELVNGPEIVVATPASLWRQVDKCDRFILNLERCCHLVLDDADRLLDTARPLVEKTLSEYWQCLEKRWAEGVLTQVVVCAEQWTEALGEFHRTAHLGDSPLVVVGPFLEASAYTGVTTVAHFVEEAAARGSALLGVVQGNPGRKTVVCTAEKESAVAVHKLLLLSDVRALVLHQGLSLREVSELATRWGASSGGVLVVQDSVLPWSGIRDAAVLIHYDVPEVSSPAFGFRYSCIAEGMPVFHTKVGAEAASAVRPVVHLLLCEDSNASSAPELAALLERLASPVPDGWGQLAQQEEQRRQGSGERSLCPRLKAFGRCQRPGQCSHRHRIVPEVDHPPSWSHLPSAGEVRILVTKVIDASHFFAWVLQERATALTGRSDRTAVRKNQELQEALKLMNEYFGNKGNYRMLAEGARPEVGQVYGLEVSTGRFQRVLVRSVEGTGAEPVVTVAHMDYGGQSCVAASRLLYLPEPLQGLAPFAVEVYCCRLQPWDGDQEWPPQASATAHRLFSRKELVGRVVLRVGPVLWLDPLVLPQQLPHLGLAQTVGQHVRLALLQHGLALDNAQHVEDVRRAAQQAGLPLPPLRSPVSARGKESSLAQPSRAFLETTGYTDVFLCTVESPSHFYVRNRKFDSCLEALEDDIQRAVETGQARPLLQSVWQGRACLARFEGIGRWYRAQVREVLNEGQEAVVFFADYGDTGRFPTNQLLAVLPWMMLLPYQAVPCSLAGVRPEVEDGWAPTAGSTLEDFGYDGADNSRPLCLRVARRRRDGQGGGSSYEVLLFDSCEAGRASAADWLIQKGMAVATELPPLDFDWTVPHASLLKEEEAASEGQTDSEDAKELACRMEMEEQMSRMFGEYNRFVLSSVCGLPKEVSGAAERVGATPSSPPPRSTEVDPEKGCASEGSSEAHESQQVAPGDQVPTLDPVSDTGGSRRPPVLWWQDKKRVHVTVLVPDAVSCKLKVTASVIFLRVRARGGREHVVCERLFARVKPKKTELVEKPGGIKLTLEKECPSLTWEFLTLQRKKLSSIRYDLDHVVVSDDEEEGTSSFVTLDEGSSEEDQGPSTAALTLSTDRDLPGFVEGTQILPYDLVAHEVRQEEIEDEELDGDTRDPNNIFERN
ncbi:putative ATP-dependent RNA helicase TDRD12 isoform X2 [Haemaphysalis longicornis]